MAELVGLISAVTGIATLGFKLAQGMSNVADELGTAGSQLKSIATDTRAIALVLHELKRHLKTAKSLTKEALEIAHEIIAQCQTEVEELEKCIAPLSDREENRSDLSWSKRVRWLFAKSKLATRKAALDSLKLTLNIYIAALDFMDGEDGEEYMRTEVKHMVAQCKKTKTAFLSAERHDFMVEEAYSLDKANQDGLELPKAIERSTEDSQGETEYMDSGDETSLARTHKVESGVESMRSQQKVQMFFQRTDFQIIETLSDDQFVRIGEHIRIQTITSQFALMALNQGRKLQSDESLPETQTNPKFNFTRRYAPHISEPEDLHNQSASPSSGGFSQKDPSSTETFDGLYNESSTTKSESHSVTDQTEAQSSHTQGFPYPQYDRSQSRQGSQSWRASSSAQHPGSRSQYDPSGNPYESQPSSGFYPQYAHASYPENNPYTYPNQQWGYYPGWTQQPPAPFQWSRGMAPDDSAGLRVAPDPEKERLAAELAEFKARLEAAKSAERQRVLENQIRKDAEETFQRRMEDMRKAQEEAKAEAERAARIGIESELKMEEERQRRHEETLKEIESKLRLEFQAKKAAEERSRGLKRFFN